jgi:hypothetical protein
MDWKQVDEEHERIYNKSLEAAKKSNAADRDFAVACKLARDSAKNDGLFGVRDEWGEFHYTDHQGFKAACLGREDAAAALGALLAVLHRLDSHRRLLWVAIGLLAYIAYRLS